MEKNAFILQHLVTKGNERHNIQSIYSFKQNKKICDARRLLMNFEHRQIYICAEIITNSVHEVSTE